MSADEFFRFPFRKWQKKQIDGAVAKVRERLGSAFMIESEEAEPDDETEGSFEIVFVEKTLAGKPGPRERSGRFFLESGDEETRAYLHIDTEVLEDPAVRTAQTIAKAFCEVLGGKPETGEEDDEDEDEAL